jgi:hypothetical protein
MESLPLPAVDTGTLLGSGHTDRAGHDEALFGPSPGSRARVHTSFWASRWLLCDRLLAENGLSTVAHGHEFYSGGVTMEG